MLREKSLYHICLKQYAFKKVTLLQRPCFFMSSILIIRYKFVNIDKSHKIVMLAM